MTRFWWMRHGPTHVKTMVGWTDVPADLSDSTQLTRLRAALPDAPVICSDLLRTRQTAEALEREIIEMTPELREFHFGEWENKGFGEIDDPALRRYFEDPGDLRAPGGESWNDVAQRVSQKVDTLCGRYTDLILVAHMGVILTQWCRATGLTPYEAMAQKISPLSMTRIDAQGGHFKPVFANHIP